MTLKNYQCKSVKSVTSVFYKRGNHNEPGSFLTHFFGASLSVAALVVLIVRGASEGGVWHIVSFSIFGASLVLLYSSSSIYHLINRKSKIKAIFRILDHSMIYILIAGSYTPLNLIALRAGWGWTLFGLTWGFAFVGIVLKTIFKEKIRSWLSAIPYIAMGWIGLLAILEIFEVLSPMALYWMFLGGIFYTVGTVFFGLATLRPYPKWLGYHELFHLFVLAGSFSHFWLMWEYMSRL